MKFLTLVLLIGTMSCVHRMTQYEQLMADRNIVTLEFKNSGPVPYRVYVWYDNVFRLIGYSTPGETACFILPEMVSSTNIVIVSVEGQFTTPDFTAGDAPDKAWKMEIGFVPHYEINSVIPARTKCK